MSMNSETKMANAIGGKTARACDSCLRKRARWFCAADEAFLCQSCDASVHSANQLASRHERVRLETSSLKGSSNEVNSSMPAWHQGFTRKARTPRKAKSTKLQPRVNHPFPLVPEINGDDPSFAEENDEQLLFRVPVFDPIFDDLYKGDGEEGGGSDGIGNIMFGDDEVYHDLNLDKLLTGDAELEVFGTDVESFLGMGIGKNSLRMGQHEEYEVGQHLYGEKVKVEEEDDEDDEEVQAVIACHFDPALDMEFNWDFNYSSSTTTWKDVEDMKMVDENKIMVNIESGSGSLMERKMLLTLNYEAVVAAWATQGCPWKNGIRPQLDLDQFSVACLEGGSHPYGGDSGRSSIDDAGRQARVSRYREKRRTRLFAKKIRYEVRKLNAEKRPRMKGRFVKRTSLSGSTQLPNYLKNK